MDKAIDLTAKSFRFKSKSIGLIFNYIIDKKELYEYYSNKLKGTRNNELSVFVVHNIKYHSSPNTTILLDFGAITDRTSFKHFKFNDTMPEIRKILADNFLRIVEELEDSYPKYVKKDLAFSFEDINEDIRKRICPECKSSREPYEFSNKGIICKYCINYKNTEEGKRDEIRRQMKEIDPGGKLERFMSLYLEDKDIHLKSRVEKLELENANHRKNLAVLANFITVSKKTIDESTFNKIRKEMTPCENVNMGILFLNLGEASNYMSFTTSFYKVKNQQEEQVKKKLVIMIVAVEDEKKFYSELIRNYKSYDLKFDVKYKAFMNIFDKVILEYYEQSITEQLNKNSFVERLGSMDVLNIEYKNVFMIDKTKLYSLEPFLNSFSST
jgi:hypothetical protein